MKNVEPMVKQGLAIVGPYGNIWTNEIFETEEEAITHLKKYWENVTSFDLSRWSVIPCNFSITPKKEEQQVEKIPLQQRNREVVSQSETDSLEHDLRMAEAGWARK